MKFFLMRYYFSPHKNNLILDLYNPRKHQTIELIISLYYWDKSEFKMASIDSKLHVLSIKRYALTLDEWLNIVKEQSKYEYPTE